MTQLPTSGRDVFIYQSHDPHTAIPDWLAFRSDITAEARGLAFAILVLCKGPIPPAIPEIAERLSVDERTVYRWLNELRVRGVLTTELIGRRNFYRFHATPDRGDQVTHGSGDRGDQVTHGSPDPCVRGTPPNSNQFLTQQDAANSVIPANPISDPPVGVVGDHDSSKQKKPTPTNRAPLKTPLARWLKQAGMNAARLFDCDALDYWTYRRFVQDKRAAGWEWRQIVSTLREAPLDLDPHAAPLEQPLEQPLDQGDELPTPAPAGRSIEEAQARWDARRGGRL